MKTIIKGIVLTVFLSMMVFPLTSYAKPPEYKLIAASLAYSVQEGVKDGYCEYEIVAVPSGDSWWDVWSNHGQGWWEMEEELNKNGIYLDENGMIMEGTVYTMPNK